MKRLLKCCFRLLFARSGLVSIYIIYTSLIVFSWFVIPSLSPFRYIPIHFN